ncbi:MAG TPA: methyltransferase, partial [Gemmatimonadaceae bacterium]|nr:methyltransferase [Gemmatimonadaceae bacterium]
MTATGAGAAIGAIIKPSSGWLVEPFTMGTPGEFARVRETLVRIGYTERALCERAKVQSIYDLAVLPIADTPIGKPSDALSAVAHLFLEGARIPWTVVRSLLDKSAIDAFQALGVLVSLTTDPDVCIAPLAIYPVAGLYIASDRYGSVFDVAQRLPTDLVYAALTPEARDFVRLMPRVQCDDYLELCSGTGIAALIAARSFAKRAWGIDITERSTRFARFNAALNDLDNATMLEGDLYTPVAGRTFDLIAAHPPYVPSLDDDMVFRDGGDDGERVTRGILAGVADHLRPGGRFFCACMLTDRKGLPLESRIRSMLGPHESDFDLVVGQRMQYDIEAHFANAAQSGQITKETLARMLRRFQELGVERFIGTGFLVRRRPEHATRASVTRRRVTTPKTIGAYLEWSLEWA